MIHVVSSGETIYSIAARYGRDVNTLSYINQVPAPYTLAVGQALLIPQENAPAGPITIRSNGFAYPFISSWVLQESLPYLTHLSVFSYGFTEEGALVEPPLDDSFMIERALLFGVAPVLTLTPFGIDGNFNNLLISALINSTSAVDRLIGELLAVMERKGFAALDIDFEFILAEDRDAFSGFVEQVTARMNENGYEVSVDLAPKTSREQRGLLYEGKDYARLGAAANQVLLMTYEWGYKYGPPLAVAPLDKVRQVVEYALTEIPAEKVNIGLANYGYDWKLPYVRSETVATTIGLVEAVQIAVQYGAQIQFDETAQSPYFYYTDENGDAHVVWFEDVRSWDAKFSLIQELSLSGTGIWQIMRLFRAGLVLLSERFS